MIYAREFWTIITDMLGSMIASHDRRVRSAPAFGLFHNRRSILRQKH